MGSPSPIRWALRYFLNKKMARVTGLEPATSGVTGRRSNQLSYTPARGERRISQPRAQVNTRMRFCPG